MSISFLFATDSYFGRQQIAFAQLQLDPFRLFLFALSVLSMSVSNYRIKFNANGLCVCVHKRMNPKNVADVNGSHLSHESKPQNVVGETIFIISFRSRRCCANENKS